MSHKIVVKTHFTDHAALVRACTLLGWTRTEDAAPQLFGGKRGPVCEYVMTPPMSRRQLGFALQADGTYEAVLDSMDRRYLDDFTQQYNYAVIESVAALHGARVTDLEWLADGTLSLIYEDLES